MSHAQEAAINVASTIQSMSVKRNPDPVHDLAPETAADRKAVVEIDPDADIDELSDVAEDEMYVVLPSDWLDRAKPHNERAIGVMDRILRSEQSRFNLTTTSTPTTDASAPRPQI
jgi:hypothetical protein